MSVAFLEWTLLENLAATVSSLLPVSLALQKWFLFALFPALLTCPALQSWWPRAPLTPWQEACPTNGIINDVIFPLMLKMALSLCFYAQTPPINWGVKKTVPCNDEVPCLLGF